MGSPAEPFRTVIEPFRIHAVEPLAMTTLNIAPLAHNVHYRSIGLRRLSTLGVRRRPARRSKEG